MKRRRTCCLGWNPPRRPVKSRLVPGKQLVMESIASMSSELKSPRIMPTLKGGWAQNGQSFGVNP
jgi:hypothetical protein